MKSKDCKSQIVNKARLTNYVDRKDLRKLLFRYLCEKNLWHKMVMEVRHQHPEIISGAQVLHRMVSNANTPRHSMLTTDCTFDWRKALIISCKGGLPWSEFWNDKYDDWVDFLTDLANIRVDEKTWKGNE